MRKQLLFALIAATTALTPAFATAQERRGGDHRGMRVEHRQSSGNHGAWRGGDRQRSPRTFTPRPSTAPRSAVPGRTVQRYSSRGGDRSDWRGGDRDRGHDGRQDWRGNGRGDRDHRRDRDDRHDSGSRYRDYQRRYVNRVDQWRNVRDFDDRRAWNHRWRSDHRYDWRSYRAGHRSLYRLPRYYAPRGYSHGYRRFSVGLTLGSVLYGQQYWIGDPGYYRLPPAYGQYRWVRYYNDALLVDVRSGRVVDAIYDIFW